MSDRDPEVVASLEKGMALFNAREFFEAHEVWEETWGEIWEDERHLLQGLIQVAAGFYKLQLGQPAGTAKLLEKSLTHLRAVPRNFYALDLDAIIAAAEVWGPRAKEMVEQWRTDFDEAALPQLMWLREHGR
jgi:predicted metal-dependent hydrolase